MKLATASVTALAAVGLIAGLGAASACEWNKRDVTAMATPAPAPTPERIATPVTTGSVRVADAAPAAVLPTAPKEEEAD